MINAKAKHIKAAETALGVEPIGAETKKESELRRRWEGFLAPLGLALREEYPPQDMWYRIQASLDRADDRKTIKQTKRRIWRWRLATFGATAVAAGLAAFIAVKKPASPSAVPQAAEQYVAIATPDGNQNALIIDFDLDAGVALVRPIGVDVEEERDLQMWRLAPESDPVSVGLLVPNDETRLPLVADLGDTIAVSLEPKGGSKTDAPSGPVVYSGKLIALSQ